jgi:hypothetical protein
MTCPLGWGETELFEEQSQIHTYVSRRGDAAARRRM